MCIVGHGYTTGVHFFLNGISPKMNVTARLGLELAYYDVLIQYFSHDTTETPTVHKVKIMMIIYQTFD